MEAEKIVRVFTEETSNRLNLCSLQTRLAERAEDAAYWADVKAGRRAATGGGSATKCRRIPFEQVIERAFAHSGVTIVYEGEAPVTLRLGVKVILIEAEYGAIRASLETGAIVSGKLMLSVTNRAEPLYQDGFFGKVDPPLHASVGGYQNPAVAALSEPGPSLAARLVRLVYVGWGASAIRPFMTDVGDANRWDQAFRMAALQIAAIDPSLESAAVFALGDSDPAIVELAAAALGAQRAKAAVVPLLEKLQTFGCDRDGVVLVALADIGDMAAIPAIIELLENPDRGACGERAVRALHKLSGQTLGDAPTAWRKWFESRRQRPR